MSPGSQLDPVLLELFRTELETHSRTLEEGLVKAEGEPSAQTIEPLMRAAHSIKGAARMLALNPAVALAHAIEDALIAAQRGDRLGAAEIDLLLRANDVFVQLARSAVAGIPQAIEQNRPAFEALTASLVQSREAARAPEPAKPLSAATPSATPAAAPDDRSVRVFSETLDRLVGLAGESLVHARSGKSLLLPLMRLKRDCERLAARPEDPQHGPTAPAPDWGSGEAAGVLEALRRHWGELDQFCARLELLSERLYNEAVSSRMCPFSDAVRGFSRMVHDLARATGKRVRFEIEGESTPVDREVLVKLEAPLTHLLRNAVDHGIEPPDRRVSLGKTAEGTLLLSARHTAGSLRIVVKDDGAGIDMAELRRRIVTRGYVAEEISAEMAEAELLEFLFLPGFSTAEAVTEYSGRGIGLDVVQSMARSVGGAVRVEAAPGQGTAFTLQLPLTLSVVRSLLVAINGEAYAFPLVRIDRVLRIARDEIEEMEGRQYCTIDGEHVGIVDAHQILDTPAPSGGPGPIHLLVVSDRLNRYGLAVDNVLGLRDLVVKPLDPKLGRVPNVSACAILENGDPALILDVEDIVRSIDQLLARTRPQKLAESRGEGATLPKRVLVVDDSLTVREVERRLLESRGYGVSVAVDGIDGWNTMQNSAFDLVVTDVDMPRLNGIELVRRVRGAPRLSRIPVVIVSYKEQEEYRTQGMEAGANYYLTKSSFHDETFLNAIRDLIGEA